MNEQEFTNIELTPVEEKLIEVMINPENRMKSITDICQLAECSRTTYYKAFKKPHFVKIYEDEVKSVVKQSIGAVVSSFVKEAKRGSYQHGKVLLEMGGIYAEKQEIEINIKKKLEDFIK